MIEKEYILEKLEHLREAVKAIKTTLTVSPQPLEKTSEWSRAISSTVDGALADMVAIGGHVIDALGLERPTGDSHILRILSVNNVISSALFKEVKKILQFKTILVNELPATDYQLIDELNSAAQSFEDFIFATLAFLERQETSSC